MYFFLVEFGLFVFGLAVKIDEDEMLLLVKFRCENRLLHQKHIHHLHVQPNLLLDLSFDRINHGLAHFNVSAGESVPVKPFVGLSQQNLSLVVDNQCTNGWFGKDLVNRRFRKWWPLVGRGHLRSVVTIGSKPFFSRSLSSLFIPSQSLAIFF